jgi:formylglycine-generating enzyme required for sulfatase activity
MRAALLACVCWSVLVGSTKADVFHMPSGLTSLETVTVGNPGNAPDMRWMVYNEPPLGAVPYVYQIGKFEVTAGQYAEFLNAVAKTDSYGLYNTDMDTAVDRYGCNIKRTGSPGTYRYSVASDWANRPVNYLSWGDEARFANWLSNGQPSGAQGLTTTEDGSYYLNGAFTDAELMAVTRKASANWVIPSEDEWYKAAYHDKSAGLAASYFDYPTGTNSVPSNVLTSPDPGNNANFWQGLGLPTIGSPYWRTEAGAFTNSASPYGTFDQGGNVEEWNETAFTGSSRGWRGGSCGGDSAYLFGGVRSDSVPRIEYGNGGFRVASVPEPGTTTLAVMGGVCLLAYAWRRRKG